jgi:hypothetical protein
MARELTTAGARTAYVPEALPANFEDQEPTDFSGPTYENLRNCASGLPALFDRHVREAAAIKSDPQWLQYWSEPLKLDRNGATNWTGRWAYRRMGHGSASEFRFGVQASTGEGIS